MPEYIEFCPYATQHPFYFISENRKATRMEAIYDLFQLAYRHNHTSDTFRKGQLVTTAKQLSVRWKWTLPQTKAFLNKLIKDSLIHISTAKTNYIDTLVISILNYHFIDEHGKVTELSLENGVIKEIQHNNIVTPQNYPFKKI